MLITFRSKAAADVLMLGEHATRILEVLHKDLQRGVITAEQAPQALALLEQKIAELREQAAAEQDDNEDAEERKPAPAVSFATRAFPLMEMLRAAHAKGHDVVWGV